MQRRRTTVSKDPLAPVESVVRASVFFLTAVLALGVILGAIHLATSGSTGVTVLGLGDGESCGILDPSGGGTYVDGTTEGDGPARPSVGIVDFRADVARYQPDAFEVCLTDPTVAQEVVGSAGQIGTVAAFYLVSWVLLGAVRSARDTGLFVAATVARVRRLGLVLLAVGLVLPVVRAVADGIIVAAAVEGRAWYADIDRLGFSWSLLVTGLGVITVARVLGRAALLQEDVDATI